MANQNAKIQEGQDKLDESIEKQSLGKMDASLLKAMDKLGKNIDTSP
ncbi:MAG: hypothetical protein IPP37_15085 [Saprospiraceae bacterium]|nr:hypothetical protein [Saprospiraceae bacterium]MBL0083652.1 hypothetical protein [Saprospiraceae bacterium]